MENKEIEFGAKISNGQQIINLLSKRYGKPKIIKVQRLIYKTPNGKYFFKVSKESTAKGAMATFSLKEDLLSMGIDSGIKVSDEVDVPVDEIQLSKLEQILVFLRYQIASEFKKVRHEFLVERMSVVVDKYEDNYYFEVEGDSKEKINNFVKTLPIIEIK
ncbi:MAG: hypothetical protein COU64_06120 [Candidatus Pacebacteria bacterium CG10_big_fil_rev_8_21_14_0_10_40_26]|nr:MAG: hypothetical protein COU64_06120 [Candidatus Pacebacteria bacterium CG10_big_fil_rev_8_21_14_0_10_40_26]